MRTITYQQWASLPIGQRFMARWGTEPLIEYTKYDQWSAEDSTGADGLFHVEFEWCPEGWHDVHVTDAQEAL